MITDLYPFHSSFAEVSLHLDVDLHVANIAGDVRTNMSPTIMPYKSCDAETTEPRRPKEQKETQSPDVEVEQHLSFVVLCVCLYPDNLHGLEESEGIFDWRSNNRRASIICMILCGNSTSQLGC